MRALPLVLVALLVLSPIAGASALTVEPSTSAIDATDAASNHTATNATGSVLSIEADDVQRSTTGEQYVDLGPAVAFGSSSSAARIDTLAIVERIERADNPERRSQEFAAALDAIERRLDHLREREREAIDAYSAGEMTPRAFLLELARIDAQARALEDRRTRLVELATEDEEFELDRGRIATIERRTDALTGPVRAHAREVFRGRMSPNRFFIATGADSVILSTITEETYVREVFRGDHYSANETDIGPETALQITAESYPILWELRRDNTDVIGSSGNYLVRMPHERGTLEAFVDGGSRAVYKEFQARPLESFVYTRSSTATRDGLALTTNYTYPGGPTRIELVDADDGTPVNANVTVSANGQESELLGRSGSDGTIWTLAPQGEFTLTAIRGNDVVVQTVEPRAPPPAGQEREDEDEEDSQEQTEQDQGTNVTATPEP